MGFRDSCNVWIQNSNGRAEAFEGFIQLSSDHTATTLYSTVLVAYPEHAILLNVFARGRQGCKDRVHTMVRFLPVCSTRKQLEEVVLGEEINIVAPMHTIDEGGIGERRTGYWRFNERRTKDESTVRSYERSSRVSAEM